IWGSFMQREGVLEPGDVEEGLGAAAAVGDDRLQRMSTGTVSPETFTHGTSAQRSSWFRRGLESGRVESCPTQRPPVAVARSPPNNAAIAAASLPLSPRSGIFSESRY